MKNKSVFAMLLSLLMLTASCGSTATSVSDTGTTVPQSEETTADPLADNLPEKDFGGYEFRFFVRSDTVNTYTPESESGDVVDDAVYKRNRTVEERFNIKLISVDSGADSNASSQTTAIEKIIQSGDDACDLVLHIGKQMSNSALNGFLVNLYDINYLDFSRPWWSSQLVDDLTFNGRMYACSNNLHYDEFAGSKVYYFNKKLIEDYKLSDPYQLVFDGKWTLDKLIGMTKDVYKDVNGDGNADTTDLYGMLTTLSHNAWSVVLDIPEWQKNKDTIEVVANSDKMLTAFEKVHDWYFETSGVYTWNGASAANLEQLHNMFKNNLGIFAFGFIGDSGNYYRDTDVDYGIIPYPKYDEAQENYRVFLGVNSINMFAVPVTATDTDRTGIIIEALSAEGYKQLIPAYYEVALKDKYLRDEDSVRMLDLITASRTISFSYMYDNYGGAGLGFGNCFQSNYKDSYATFYAARESVVKARVDEVIKAFTK